MKSPGFILIFITVLLSAPLIVTTGDATEEYAESTGTECKACHMDPLGGGDLNDTGRGYLLAVDPEALQADNKSDPVSRAVRLLFLYIHTVTAFLWFGTILYVHLVLKPAYASMGLPRGEVRVGLVSMAVMAVTGIVLTHYKISSFTLLFTSRFGILLLAKIVIFSIMVSSALLVVLVIGPKLKKKKSLHQAAADKLTTEELGNFDGAEGRPAYIAYMGRVYDVSQSKLWNNGSHMKRHQAGVDLTGILAQAPHGEDKILSMPEVGQLSKQREKSEAEVPRKVFFFMAYMNLGLVFVISLILALWRW